ncbi:recombinase zinc beta ribbon domain-containing protein [Clostridium tyrobutyricum]|uniref:recombinase zinc beta ribbon domain-containing protein n=1 Tax=Clostridium tyrobutyricum TaxID=1519 RepID=UPI00242C58AA|nr:recombinase zinc beta ribbon domain-containing protein [Clostridium tyrobutyricum]
MELHGTNSYSHNTETNPFACKIICDNCNKIFSRKGWKTGIEYRKVWQCSERYKVKGVIGCNNRHVDEVTLEKAFVMSWNDILENKAHFIEKWKRQTQGDDLLLAYRAERFIALVQDAEPIEAMETDFMLETLDHIKIFEDGLLLVVFLDGTEIECKNDE